MDAVTLIGKYGKTVQIRRQAAAGDYVNRQYVPGAYLPDIPVKMSLQPIEGEELVILQAGDRTKEFKRAYTATQVFTAQQAPSKKADLIIEGSVKWEVQKVETWESSNNNIQPFWKAIIAKVNP